MFGADLYAPSVLISKISASELSRKFIKSALLVGESELYNNNKKTCCTKSSKCSIFSGSSCWPSFLLLLCVVDPNLSFMNRPPLLLRSKKKKKKESTSMTKKKNGKMMIPREYIFFLRKKKNWEKRDRARFINIPWANCFFLSGPEQGRVARGLGKLMQPTPTLNISQQEISCT